METWYCNIQWLPLDLVRLAPCTRSQSSLNHHFYRWYMVAKTIPKWVVRSCFTHIFHSSFTRGLYKNYGIVLFLGNSSRVNFTTITNYPISQIYQSFIANWLLITFSTDDPPKDPHGAVLVSCKAGVVEDIHTYYPTTVYPLYDQF